MAVGIIIGVAFTKIVTSLVNDVLMPPLGFLIGGIDFSSLKIVLNKSAEATAPAVRYGLFLNNIIDFLIIALIIFVLVKGLNQLKSPGLTAKKTVLNAVCPSPKLLDVAVTVPQP